MIKVLLVEDDPLIAQIVQYYLQKQGSYELEWARDCGEAMASARDHFDVILLDVLLPDANGIDLCAQLRKWHHCPIIFLSCIDDSETIVRALERGGDDYIVKPFDNKILEARIQANLRRIRMDHEEAPENLLSCKGYILDAREHVVYKGKEKIALSPMEYRVLRFFMQNPKEYYNSDELYKKIWGKDYYGDVRTVLVHVHNIRQKTEDDPSNPRYLKNVWGKGYIFDPKGGSD